MLWKLLADHPAFLSLELRRELEPFTDAQSLYHVNSPGGESGPPSSLRQFS
jgi:hypothetical protein